MSVINETLDNLKQTQVKKRVAGAVSSASNPNHEKVLKTEKVPFFKKAYMIPVSFALLVGALFYITQLFFSTSSSSFEQQHKVPQTDSWFKINLQKFSQSKSAMVSNIRVKEIQPNSEVTNMYYNAMALLNEGNEQQALQALKKIVALYPEFSPAQKAYNTMTAAQ